MKKYTEQLEDLFSGKTLTKEMKKALMKFNKRNIDFKIYKNIREVYINEDYFSIELYSDDIKYWKFIDINTRELCDSLNIEVNKITVKNLKSVRAINKEVKETYGFDSRNSGGSDIKEIMAFAGLNLAQQQYFFTWLFDNYNIMRVYGDNTCLLIKKTDSYSTKAYSSIDILPQMHKYIKEYYTKKDTKKESS